MKGLLLLLLPRHTAVDAVDGGLFMMMASAELLIAVAIDARFEVGGGVLGAGGAGCDRRRGTVILLPAAAAVPAVLSIDAGTA